MHRVWIRLSPSTALPTEMIPAANRWSSWMDVLSDPVVQSVLGVVILLVISAVALFALSRLRDSNTDNQRPDELLAKNFEEMRSEGDIDEQEFRKIKALLGDGKRAPSTSEAPSSSRSTTS
ncbi:MAG: hypothetical protein ACK5OB_12365 [Pirellula sp.]